MMKFTFQFDENSPLVEMTLGANSDLTEVLGAFQGFLQAATYQFKEGDCLEVVNENETQKEPNE